MPNTQTPREHQEALSYLKRCPRVQGLPPADLEALAALCMPVTRGAGENLFKIKVVAEHIYLLCSGSVEFATRHRQGQPIAFGNPLAPGHFFGEVAALSVDENGRHTRTANTRAHTAISAVKLTWADLKRFVRQHPDAEFLLDMFVEDMAGRLRRSGRDLSLFTLQDPNEGLQPEGFDKFIKSLAGGFSSLKFLVANVTLIAFWFLIGRRYGVGFDSMVGLIGLVLTVEALLVTTIVLNSQSREARYEAIRTNKQYENIAHIAKVVEDLQTDVESLQSDTGVLLQSHAAGEGSAGSSVVPHSAIVDGRVYHNTDAPIQPVQSGQQGSTPQP